MPIPEQLVATAETGLNEGPLQKEGQFQDSGRIWR